MGVDFENCELCGDIRCSDNMISVDIKWKDYGRYNVCNYCLGKYFIDITGDDENIQEEILCDSGMIFYVAKKKTDINEEDENPYSKADILFYADCKSDLVDKLEEGVEYVYGFYDDKKEMEERDPFFYESDELDLCFAEAFDTYLSIQPNALDSYQRVYEPNDIWKQQEKLHLTKEIKKLQYKLSKFQ